MKLKTLLSRAVSAAKYIAAPVLLMGAAFAVPPAGGAGTDSMSFATLATNVGGTGNDIMKIVMVVITIAGIFLVLKGLVHLKQNYTSGGGGQEKHLSKGIASLVFGACLFLVIPITHALVGGLSGTNKQLNTWSVTNYSAGNLTSSSTNPA